MISKRDLPLKLQAIDESNRSAHYYLAPDDKCYFLHEFTARKGYAHSPGNQFIFNFKKSPTKQAEPQYQHKLRAIQEAIFWYRSIFDQVNGSYTDCTYVPIPPSKKSDHSEYDDRMWRVVQGICQGNGADGRELILQTDSYDAAHLAGEGATRIKPDELRALYRVSDVPPKTKRILIRRRTFRRLSLQSRKRSDIRSISNCKRVRILSGTACDLKSL